MYDPKGNARDRAVEAVEFVEAEPPDPLRGIVHRFLSVRTLGSLDADYRFHALPDACVYIVFDQADTRIAGVTRLRASSEELNLGRAFHFVNVRFLPGVWQGDVGYGQIETPYRGDLPLAEVNRALSKKEFDSQVEVLSRFVQSLAADGVVTANPVTKRIFDGIEDIHSVADMAEVSGLSTRQLQRVLKQTTGFAPHDFLKVIRLQQSLLGEPSLSYADQSHFIHSFRRATGYTPGQYTRKFDV